MARFRDTHFVLKPTKQAFWSTRNLHGIVWKSGCLDYSEIPSILPRGVRGLYFANGSEKCQILGNFFDKEVEDLDDLGCPKLRDLVEELWICSSYPFRQKTTLHFAKCKAKLLGNWTTAFKFVSFLYCEMFRQYLSN